MELTPIEYDDFEAVKTDLATNLDKFKGLVVTDSKQAKKARAGLNKVSKSIDDRKKELKQPYVEAYKPMENQAKELKHMIDEVKVPIDKQIKEIESGEKLERIKKVKSLVAEMAFSYRINPDMVDIKEGWLKKSISDIELKREVGEELKLMVKFGAGVLPDGVNYQNGKLIDDDGEILQIRSIKLYVTPDQYKIALGGLGMDRIKFTEGVVTD